MPHDMEFVKEYGGAREFRLPANGLRFLLVPNSAGESVACMVHYNVGSIHEGVGHTGSAHFLEHLLFKGSKNHPRETDPIKKIFARTGAMYNANTWYDRTAYFEIILPEYLELFMALEADRMRDASFTDKDRQDEMPVVRNELEIEENNAAFSLAQLVRATAIREHPYHHPTIGWRCDVEGVPTARIREFYDTFYHPNNALVILIGNVDEAQALELIVKHFGEIPASPHAIEQVYTQEPPQQGERRFILKRVSKENGVVALAWVVPGASHPDFPALCVLQAVMSQGNHAFLQDAFVKSGKVQSIGLSLRPFRDPFPMHLEIRLLKKRGHRSVEREVLEYLTRLQKEGISSERIERAKRLAQAYEWYGRDGFMHMLMGLSVAEGAGSWELYFRNLEAIKTVTPEDVMRVFTTYVRPDAMTAGWFVPQRSKEGVS